jgi:hypothetical protein
MEKSLAFTMEFIMALRVSLSACSLLISTSIFANYVHALNHPSLKLDKFVALNG